MDAQALAAAMEGGTLSLSLRAVGETDVSATRPVHSTQLARRPAAKRKTPPRKTAAKPAPVNSRTDIIVFRGEEKTNVMVLSEKAKSNMKDVPSSTELAGG